MPIACFHHDSLDSPQMVATKGSSDSYNDHVLAGRVLIADQESQLRRWAFSYEEDLGPSGRALFLEVGGRGFGDAVTFVQRYTFGNDHGLRLLGDLEVVGEEFLQPERLESRHWRYLMTEGATNHDLAGQNWLAWVSARDHTQAKLYLGEFSFVVPEGWIFEQAQEGHGWKIIRLLPWQHKGLEPIMMSLLSTYPDQATLEDVVEGRKVELLGEGGEVLEATISQALPSLPLLMAGRLSWTGETEGRSFRAQRVWVPTDAPGRFLVLWAASFSMESWEWVVRALDAVLTSLEVSQRGSGELPRADGDSRSWLTKLWQKWRP